MKKLLVILLFSGCATMEGSIGYHCLEQLVCEKGAICAYDNERLGWFCVEQDKIKPKEQP